MRSRASLVNTRGPTDLDIARGGAPPVDSGLLPATGLTNGGPKRYEPWRFDVRSRTHKKQRVMRSVTATHVNADRVGSGLTRGPGRNERGSLTTGGPTLNGSGLTSGWGLINGTGMTHEPGFHRDVGKINGSGDFMTSSLASSEGMTNGSGLTDTTGLAPDAGMTNGSGLTRGEGLTNGRGLVKGPGTLVPAREMAAARRPGRLRSLLRWGAN